MAVQSVKRYAALIESSEFDWSEAKAGCNLRDSGAGTGIIARHEHDLPLPFPGPIGSKLRRRQMIERLYEARPDKCFGHDFRRETTSQVFRRNIKCIRDVDNDLAFPGFELLRNILVRRKWDSEEDHPSLMSVLNGLGNDARTEFFCQGRKRLRSAAVCNCDMDFLVREQPGQCGADIA